MDAHTRVVELWSGLRACTDLNSHNTAGHSPNGVDAQNVQPQFVFVGYR